MARPGQGTVGSIPLPFNVTVWVVSVPASLVPVMESAPLRVPVVVGVKVTLMVHEPPAARLLPHLLVWPKSPLVAMLVMASAATPVLLSVTGCEALVVPSN